MQSITSDFGAHILSMTFFRTILMAAAVVANFPATTDAFSMNPAMAYFTQMIEHKLQHQAKEVGVPKQKKHRARTTAIFIFYCAYTNS